MSSVGKSLRFSLPRRGRLALALLAATSLLTAGVAPALAGEQEAAIVKPSPLPAHGLRLPATFSGTVSDTGGNEGDWSVNVWNDQTFAFTQNTSDGELSGTTLSGLGRWHSDPENRSLILDHGKEKPLVLRVRDSRTLQWSDRDSPATQGSLRAEDALRALSLDGLLLSGMMRYFADAAVIELCLDGKSYPIAMQGDYLALERAYLEDRSAPGEPLFVILEGAVESRVGMEGPPRPTVVARQFLRADPAQSCPGVTRSPGLANTFWRIDTINGAAVDYARARTEPHVLIFDTGDGAYHATVGCNSLAGQLALDGSDLEFRPGPSTLMACPPPLDTLERQLIASLAEVRHLRHNNDSLLLLSGDNQPLIALTAVYF